MRKCGRVLNNVRVISLVDKFAFVSFNTSRSDIMLTSTSIASTGMERSWIITLGTRESFLLATRWMAVLDRNKFILVSRMLSCLDR